MQPLFYNPQTSLVDQPDKISYLVYTRQCNWNCVGCHNMRNLLNDQFVEPVSLEQIITKVKQPVIDLLIISGGEALLLKDKLVDALKIIKAETNKPIRIDTNGTNPDMASLLKESGLVDGFAIDIKFPYWLGGRLPLLKTITGADNIPVEKILRTIALADGMPYTLYRTVLYPMLPSELVDNIKAYMSKYVSPHYCNPYYHFA